jgi:DUF4097 and DUF4098 domain-containing protein YvlB
MRRNVFRALIVVGAAVAAPLGAGQAQDRPTETDSGFQWSGRIPDGAWLRIYTFNGDVEVREGDAVEVRAVKRGRRSRWDNVFFEMRRDGDNITICAIYGDEAECDRDGMHGNQSSSNVGVDFTIVVPRGARMRVSSGNGDVAVRAEVAEAHASTGNGDVEVLRSRGAVRASTGNGAVTVEDAGGQVDASTGNGRVRINTVTGPVSARSGNGNIDVRMNELRGTGDMEFRTGNGRITVALPASFEGEIDTHTGSGRLRTDFPLTVSGRLDPRRVRATIGKGGRLLRMSSGNGDLELRKM